jgi:hypothetical protein
MNKLNVFLGGTCAGDFDYRDYIIPMLEKHNISYFDPVVDDWNEAAMQNELWARETCDFCLYVITPYIKGVYSIAEVVDDSNKQPDKTIFCYLPDLGDEQFSDKMLKSLDAVSRMVKRNGATYCSTLKDVVYFLRDKLK